MSHIEKEKLIKADIASIENKVRHAFNQGYDLGFKDGKKRAKPLEQEPILDKLRAEIENLNVWGMRYNSDTDKDRKPQIVQKVKEHVIEIIDKYKAEIEG